MIDVKNIKPKEGLLIVKDLEEEGWKDSGVIQKLDHADNFIRLAEVVVGSSEYPIGSKVLYNQFESSCAFESGNKAHIFLKVSDVLGLYEEK